MVEPLYTGSFPTRRYHIPDCQICFFFFPSCEKVISLICGLPHAPSCIELSFRGCAAIIPVIPAIHLACKPLPFSFSSDLRLSSVRNAQVKIIGPHLLPNLYFALRSYPPSQLHPNQRSQQLEKRLFSLFDSCSSENQDMNSKYPVNQQTQHFVTAPVNPTHFYPSVGTIVNAL